MGTDAEGRGEARIEHLTGAPVSEAEARWATGRGIIGDLMVDKAAFAGESRLLRGENERLFLEVRRLTGLLQQQGWTEEEISNGAKATQ